MNTVNVEELVEAYLAIRNERDRLVAEHDAAVEALKVDMTQLEQMMLGACNDIGADSIKTGLGTVIRSLKERAVCNDWDNFKTFVQENGLVDLLEKRIHQGNFKEFMAQHEGDGLPPGVNVMREFNVTVRKNSK
jgi:hypothetical protein